MSASGAGTVDPADAGSGPHAGPMPQPAVSAPGAGLMPPDVSTPAPDRSLGLVLNSLAYVGGTVARMTFGFVGWLLAARLYPAVEVGLAAAVVSAMMLCAQVAVLGVDSALVLEAPRHHAAYSRLLDTTFALGCLTALGAGALFLALSTTVLGRLSIVGERPAWALLFLTLAVLVNVWALQDQFAIVVRRADQLVVRACLSGSLTVGLIALAPSWRQADAYAILAAWTMATAAACVHGFLVLAKPDHVYRPGLRLDASLSRRLLRAGLPNFAVTAADRAAPLAVPVVVTELLSATAAAHWYTVWMMAGAAYILPFGFGLVLFTEAAAGGALIPRLRRALRAALAFGIPTALGLAVVGPQLLALLGRDYQVAGTTPLRILAGGVVPLAFVYAYHAVCRATGRIAEAAATAVGGGCFGVVAAGLGAAHAGLGGTATGWLVVQVVTGLWACARLARIVTTESAHDSARRVRS